MIIFVLMFESLINKVIKKKQQQIWIANYIC